MGHLAWWAPAVVEENATLKMEFQPLSVQVPERLGVASSSFTTVTVQVPKLVPSAAALEAEGVQKLKLSRGLTPEETQVIRANIDNPAAKVQHKFLTNQLPRLRKLGCDKGLSELAAAEPEPDRTTAKQMRLAKGRTNVHMLT